MEQQLLVIASRFNGPPASGNGGYSCGVLGSRVDGPAEVTLKVPPPLDRPLALSEEGTKLLLWDGDTLVAEAVPTTVDEKPPATVSLEEARRASTGYAGFEAHIFPTCFVCGPERAAGDGLHVFAGPVDGTPVVATPWTPAADLADGGIVRPEIVWAALDCPSYFGGAVGKMAVLGRMAVDIRRPVVPGEALIVLGWERGSEGRKHGAASAITSTAGEVLAVSRSTWVELREPFPAAG